MITSSLVVAPVYYKADKQHVLPWYERVEAWLNARMSIFLPVGAVHAIILFVFALASAALLKWADITSQTCPSLRAFTLGVITIGYIVMLLEGVLILEIGGVRLRHLLLGANCVVTIVLSNLWFVGGVTALAQSQPSCSPTLYYYVMIIVIVYWSTIAIGLVVFLHSILINSHIVMHRHVRLPPGPPPPRPLDEQALAYAAKLERAHMRELSGAALRLQSLYRALKARRIAKQLRDTRDERERAALVIQSAHRCFVARKERRRRELSEASVKIQAQYRGSRARRFVAFMHAQATKIQAMFRGRRGRQHAADRRKEVNEERRRRDEQAEVERLQRQEEERARMEALAALRCARSVCVTVDRGINLPVIRDGHDCGRWFVEVVVVAAAGGDATNDGKYTVCTKAVPADANASWHAEELVLPLMDAVPIAQHQLHVNIWDGSDVTSGAKLVAQGRIQLLGVQVDTDECFNVILTDKNNHQMPRGSSLVLRVRAHDNNEEAKKDDKATTQNGLTPATAPSQRQALGLDLPWLRSSTSFYNTRQCERCTETEAQLFCEVCERSLCHACSRVLHRHPQRQHHRRHPIVRQLERGDRYCSRCEENLAIVRCCDCGDDTVYCSACNRLMHKSKRRSTHVRTAVDDMSGGQHPRNNNNNNDNDIIVEDV